jgi:hypothetical protein
MPLPRRLSETPGAGMGRTQFRAVLEKTGAANLRGLERMLASLQGM